MTPFVSVTNTKLYWLGHHNPVSVPVRFSSECRRMETSLSGNTLSSTLGKDKVELCDTPDLDKSTDWIGYPCSDSTVEEWKCVVNEFPRPTSSPDILKLLLPVTPKDSL